MLTFSLGQLPPCYPSGAKIRKNRPRCSPMGGFLCSFNTITPKSPHSKPFPIPFASVLGVNKYIVSFRKTTTGPVEYDLIVNGGNDGLTYLVVWSCNTNAGNATSSAIYMLRCGYSGNYLTTVQIASDNMPSDSSLTPSFTASQNGKMIISGPGKFLFIREPEIF